MDIDNIFINRESYPPTLFRPKCVAPAPLLGTILLAPPPFRLSKNLLTSPGWGKGVALVARLPPKSSLVLVKIKQSELHPADIDRLIGGAVHKFELEANLLSSTLSYIRPVDVDPAELSIDTVPLWGLGRRWHVLSPL